jgi:hypothetical protein
MAVFYPAVVSEGSATRFNMLFFTNLTLYKDAEVAFDGTKHPLIMLSHGRGSNSLFYGWFAQTLASPWLRRRRALSLARQYLRFEPSLISPTSCGSARSMSASTSTF